MIGSTRKSTASDDDAAFFPKLNESDVKRSALSSRTPNHIMKRVMCATKGDEEGKNYIAYSARACMVTEMASAGMAIPSMIKIHANWRSDAINRYLRPSMISLLKASAAVLWEDEQIKEVVSTELDMIQSAYAIEAKVSSVISFPTCFFSGIEP